MVTTPRSGVKVYSSARCKSSEAIDTIPMGNEVDLIYTVKKRDSLGNPAVNAYVRYGYDGVIKEGFVFKYENKLQIPGGSDEEDTEDEGEGLSNSFMKDTFGKVALKSLP
jgi:hypothetical protein